MKQFPSDYYPVYPYDVDEAVFWGAIIFLFLVFMGLIYIVILFMRKPK